ncbi:MAG: hypothetical protein K2J40_08655 [Ruminococcus sp.]|nr:hypothetical protein [Ruminococcus sp.]
MPVKILKQIDVSEYPWCNSAVMFRVHSGLGTIRHKSSAENYEDYSYYSHLTLNDKPILQEYIPICPTCEGMLATGYGTENIDCPELKAVSECLNSDYKDIKTSAETLKPLLNLLEDGYYLLADVPHNPTDGKGNFFWSVPNKMTYNNGFRLEYYHSETFSVINGFPQYLYPTQSSEVCNQKRIDEYVEILKNNPNPPRALAYHEYGFISALLDGHHKATAAALLGQQVNCLTIIKTSSCIFEKGEKSVTYDTRIRSVGFSDIKIPVPAGSLYGECMPDIKRLPEDIKITEYNLTGKEFPEAEINAKKYYLNIETLMELYAYDIEGADLTDEIIDRWINECSFDNCARLKCAIIYLMKNNRDMAYRTAVKIISKSTYHLPFETAWTALTHFKDEKTEKLMIDHIVEYGKDSLDVVKSYWD